MKQLLLNGSDWTLRCYWQNQWRLRVSADQSLKPALPVVSATVPGAVHADLLAAGLIDDWQDGLNAQHCEWVNNRDWGLSRRVGVPAGFDGRLTLECDGLDYSGHLLIDGKDIARFEGTHFRHRFDLTDHVQPGGTFEVEFVFDVAPQVDGVFGYTSRTRIFKPRFGYYWDWCTRLVNVGIWQDVRLVSRGAARFERCRVLPRVDEDLATGHVRVAGWVDGTPARLRYAVRDDQGKCVAEGEHRVDAPELDMLIDVGQVRLWWPARMGDQPLYEVALELLDSAGQVSDTLQRTVGFKQVHWLPNPDAPPGARPYLLEVNGRSTFVRGVNWVPISPLYGTVTDRQYETFCRTYQHMNVNLLRVWGGAMLEKPAFYEWCDRLGLMVWQEFPLSSSGIDNWPPEDPDVIEHLQTIGAEFIERRCHHACHVLWCGGNELQGAIDGGKIGIGKPVDESHPLMQQWQNLVDRLDPGKRFLTASPTGPRFYAHEGDFGKGLHHQTHGPWGNRPMSERYAYFNNDDSLFRSETGAPGCASLAELERHCGDQSLWPPRDGNPHWLVPAAHWIPWEDVGREFGPIPDDPGQLARVVKASRYLQAESYRYVAEATRRRHPRCSGFLVWMGHDSVHCTSNNSVIQIDGSTKPAADWLRCAWAPRHISLRHESIHYRAGQRVAGTVWIHRDEGDRPAAGEVTVNIRLLTGETFSSSSHPVSGAGASLCVAEVLLPAPKCPENLFVVELIWIDGDETVTNRYLLSLQADHPLGPTRELPTPDLTAVRIDASRIQISNTGDIGAIGVRVVSASSRQAVLADPNHVILLPGESQAIDIETLPTNWVRDNGGTGLLVEYLNGDQSIAVSG